MAEEALACFNSLENTIPTWIADLESILTAANITQAELCLAHQPARSTPQPSRKKIRSFTSSLKSSRSQDERTDVRRLHRLSPKNLTNSDALRLSQRKRNTASACSGEESCPLQFRTKPAAVVYYDGNTQKRFEQLVRAVGSSRNAIRKGKMSVKVESMARTGSSSSEGYGSEGEADEPMSPLTLNLSGKRSPQDPFPVFGQSDNTAAFDRVDARLEQAQALCERAAHQVLRDGDCTTEIKNASENLLEALSSVKFELPDLRKRARKAADRRTRNEERRRAEREREVEEQRRRSATQLTQKLLNAVAAAQPADGRIEMDALEVDDASDEEEDFNINALQFSKFAQMRSSRLVAR